MALVASGHQAHQCATLCAVPFVSSDPDAWMRPYYEVIALQEGFALLPIPVQFAALVKAIAQDHPSKAAKLREIDDLPSQRAILGSLAHIVYPRKAQREIEPVVNDSRELRCIALIPADGIDLRFMQGEDFRRTQLLRDGPAVEGFAEDWHAKLREWAGDGSYAWLCSVCAASFRAASACCRAGGRLHRAPHLRSRLALNAGAGLMRGANGEDLWQSLSFTGRRL